MRQEIVVPAYFDPIVEEASWSHLLGADPGLVAVAVANIASGPGTTLQPEWATVLGKASALGITVLGYVDTGYLGAARKAVRKGGRSAEDWWAQIVSDVEGWYEHYGDAVGGVFLDRVVAHATGAGTAEDWAIRYEKLNAHVKSGHQRAMTVVNPGSPVPKCFEESADAIVTFEGAARTYLSPDCPNAKDLPFAWRPEDPTREWHLVYSVPSTRTLERVVDASTARGAGRIFATRRATPNPYASLSPEELWPELVALVGSD